MARLRRFIGWSWVAVVGIGLCGCQSDIPAPPQAQAGDVRRGYEPRTGDILFQSLPHEPLTDAIEGASKSPFSHCGMIDRQGEQFVVVEAIGPVKETDLDEWIRRGRERGFAVFRPAEKFNGGLSRVIAAARKHLGKPYDFQYRFDDENIYCSELIFKAFRDVTGESFGVVRKLGDLDWQPYEPLIRMLDGGGLPLDREMITPKDLAEATQLQLVMRSGI